MQLEFGGRRYPVAAGDLVIGSGPDSTLVLAAPGVLPRHALVRSLGAGMAFVVPAAPGAEILVNGARLGGDPTPIMHGDKIGIGGHEVLVADPRNAGATQVISAARPADSTPTPPDSAGAAPAAAEPVSVGRLVSLNDGREYALSAVPFVIGRDAAADVVVEGDDVSRRHAEILTLPDGDFLVDSSSNGTWLNGERLRGKQALQAGDILRVGPEELRYYPAERKTPPPSVGFRLGETVIGMPALRRPPPLQSSYLAPSEPPLASLLVRSGALKGERFAIRTPVANIGRADYNDVTLDDPSVSASHAKLQLRDGVWMLADLGSTNGTTVDAEPVTGESPLSPGASIEFGEVKLLFEPRDRGVKKRDGTVVVEVQLPSAPPPAPGPVIQATVLGGARRGAVAGARRPWRWILPAAALAVGAVLLAWYLLSR
jgi:pSer/pThr/pTyr-binding forkhead associated (FHA) protein